MDFTVKQIIAVVLVLLFFAFAVFVVVLDRRTADPMESSVDFVCPWCGRKHGSDVIGRFLKRIHSILDLPTRLVGRRSPSQTAPVRADDGPAAEENARSTEDFRYITITTNLCRRFI